LAHAQIKTWALDRYVGETVWTYGYIIAVMVGTEINPEMSVIFNQVIQLIAREDFINEVILLNQFRSQNLHFV
jgi:hypothetical protein